MNNDDAEMPITHLLERLNSLAQLNHVVNLPKDVIARLAQHAKRTWIVIDTRVPGTNMHQVRAEELAELVQQAREAIIAETTRKLIS